MVRTAGAERRRSGRADYTVGLYTVGDRVCCCRARPDAREMRDGRVGRDATCCMHIREASDNAIKKGDYNIYSRVTDLIRAR